MFVSLSQFDTMALFDIIKYWKIYKIITFFITNCEKSPKKSDRQADSDHKSTLKKVNPVAVVDLKVIPSDETLEKLAKQQLRS